MANSPLSGGLVIRSPQQAAELDAVAPQLTVAIGAAVAAL